MDRNCYTDGQGHRQTGRGAGTQTDRKRERDTDGQKEGLSHRWTGTTDMDSDRNWDTDEQGQ
jgi:hypothetical protein